jgi:hypothetical protein
MLVKTCESRNHHTKAEKKLGQYTREDYLPDSKGATVRVDSITSPIFKFECMKASPIPRNSPSQMVIIPALQGLPSYSVTKMRLYIVFSRWAVVIERNNRPRR